MTKEQTEACEKLAEEVSNTLACPIIRSMYPSMSRGQAKELFKDLYMTGFKTAQTPEMLMLNPLVKELVEVCERASQMQKYHKSEYFDTTTVQCREALAPFKEGV